MSEESIPALLTDAVLHDRRDNFRRLIATGIGDDYEIRIAPLREKLRAATLDGGDLRAAHARLTGELEKTEDWRAVDAMAWASALLDCLEAAAIPTEEKLAAAEAAAPVKGKKGRKGKGGGGKAKAPTIGWAMKIGRSGTRLKFPSVRTVEEVGMWLDGAKWAPKVGGWEQNSGACIISNGGDTDFSGISKWKFGEYIVFGWRVDERKVPAGTLAVEIEKTVAEEEKNREGRKVGKAEREAIKAEVRDRLLRAAVPRVAVYPVLYSPGEAWALVEGPPAVFEEVRRVMGGWAYQLAQAVQPTIIARLTAATGERYRTDLRVANHNAAPVNGETDGKIPVGVLFDFLLWLATPGTDKRSLAWELSEKVTWKLSGGPVKIRVPVGNSFNEVVLEDADSGALPASLAEGGRLLALRLAVEDLQEVPQVEDGATATALVHTYYLSLEVLPGNRDRAASLRIHGMGLPTIKGGDSAEALVFERVSLHKRLWTMLECLFRAYASDRCQDWQPVIDAARDWVGLELTRRFVFDERTGQGWLFPPVAERVLAIEDKNAEKPKGRGRGKAK